MIKAIINRGKDKDKMEKTYMKMNKVKMLTKLVLTFAIVGMMVMDNGIVAYSSGIIEAQKIALRQKELVEEYGYSMQDAMAQATYDVAGETIVGYEIVNGKAVKEGTASSDNSGSSSSTGSSTETAPVTPEPTCTHNWTESITTEATCEKKGVLTFTCSLCEETKTESIPKKEHKYSQTDSAYGNCVDSGYITYTCEACGDSYNEETGMGEHLFLKSDESKDATCTESGCVKEVCQYCGEVKETVTEALGCEMPDRVTRDKEPTCTEDGVATYYCKRCGEAISTEVLAATGHKKSETPVVVTKATFFKEGKEQYRCMECNEVLEEVSVPSACDWKIILLVAGAVGIVLVGSILLVMKKK